MRSGFIVLAFHFSVFHKRPSDRLQKLSPPFLGDGERGDVCRMSQLLEQGFTCLDLPPTLAPSELSSHSPFQERLPDTPNLEGVGPPPLASIRVLLGSDCP